MGFYDGAAGISYYWIWTYSAMAFHMIKELVCEISGSISGVFIDILYIDTISGLCLPVSINILEVPL